MGSLLPLCSLAGILVVYVTAPSAEVADSLATALVESQLVACVNIVPGLTSVYTWKVGAEHFFVVTLQPSLILVMRYAFLGSSGPHQQLPM
jgi:hypothetical protein